MIEKPKVISGEGKYTEFGIWIVISRVLSRVF